MGYSPRVVLAHVAAARLALTPGASDLPGLGRCAGGCRCSYNYGVLGIDSSHLFLLARSAAATGTETEGAARLLDLLRAHICAGQRRLVMSMTCLDGECFRRPPVGEPQGERVSISDICSGISYSEVVSLVELLPDVEDEEVPEKVEVGARTLSLDRGERSLVQVLRQVDDAAIVTNDEDAFDVVKELAETGVISQYPLMSLNLVDYMYRCGGLTANQANLLCNQAVDSMDRRISATKRQRKERHAAVVVQRIALAEAKRGMRRDEEPKRAPNRASGGAE